MTKINDVLKKETEADRQAGWTEVREGSFRSRLALTLCRTKSDAGEVVSDVREIFTGVAACLETPRSACTRADIVSNVCKVFTHLHGLLASKKVLVAFACPILDLHNAARSGHRAAHLGQADAGHHQQASVTEDRLQVPF